MSDHRPDRTILLRLLRYGGASAALYLLGVWAFPLLVYAAHTRLYDLVQLTSRSIWGAVAYALIILALFGLYWQAARLLRHGAESEDTDGKALLVAVVGFAALFALVLMWLYPISATDLFQYFFRSHVFVHYKGNPFADLPLKFPDDPYLYIVGEWTDLGSPYGPTWELLASIAALLTGGTLIPNLLALKAISILFYGGSLGLVCDILKHLSPEHQISGTLLFAWNPLILLEWIGNGHNDAVMIFWILLAVWLWTRERYVWVVPALVVAALVKAIAIIVVPFFVLAIWLGHPTWPERLRWFGQTLALSVAASLFLFAPFGVPWGNVVGVLNEAADRYGHSFAATLVVILRQGVLVLLPRLFYVTRGTLLTLHDYAYELPRWLALGALAVLYLRQLSMVWHHKRGPVVASLETFFIYLILAPSYRMWYPAWLMTLTALHPNRDRLLRAGTACLTAELSVLIYGYQRHWPTLPRHLVGTAFTLLLPLLAPTFDRWVRQRSILRHVYGRSPRDSRQTG